jgi:hypothetical protein
LPSAIWNVLERLGSDPKALISEKGMAGKRYCEEEFSKQQSLNFHLNAYEIAYERRNLKN